MKIRFIIPLLILISLFFSVVSFMHYEKYLKYLEIRMNNPQISVGGRSSVGWSMTHDLAKNSALLSFGFIILGSFLLSFKSKDN